MSRKVKARLLEIASTARGGQDAGSRDLALGFFYMYNNYAFFSKFNANRHWLCVLHKI